MQIPVIVEQMKNNGFRARGTEPFAVSAKGSTREEALANLRTKIQNRLKKGTELVGLEIVTQPHPWMQFAGMFAGDPLFEDWQKAIEDYRRKVDHQPGHL